MTGGEYDAVVVGSGPNGLVGAITLARAGRRVLVLEAAPTAGGGCRTAALTLPGFRHDICSAVHPLGLGSPAMRALPLEEHGVRWVQPDVALAHPLDREVGAAALLHRSLDDTVEGLGLDGPAWRRLVEPVTSTGLGLVDDLLSPLGVPRHPVALARYGLLGIRGARGLAASRLRTDRGAALLAGLAAHSVLPLDRPLTSGFGLLLGALGHVVGWPFPAGGAQAITDALEAVLRSHGGEVVCDHRVRDLGELPPAPIVLADVSPPGLLALAGDRLPPRYRRRLAGYRYGPGVFKVDYALAGPVPWLDPEVARAGTVHVGGTMAEVAAAEATVGRRRAPRRPFLLVAQPSGFDPGRAPAGQHVLWAYSHVPAGSTVDLTGRVDAQLERFAPGFRDLVLERHVAGPADLERSNPNLVGGDVTGGVTDWRQFVTRPRPSLHPWRTPDAGRLPLLRLHPTRRRCPRHVRPPRRPPRPRRPSSVLNPGHRHFRR